MMSELTHGEQGLLLGAHHIYVYIYIYMDVKIYIFAHFLTYDLGLGVSERAPTLWNVLGKPCVYNLMGIQVGVSLNPLCSNDQKCHGQKYR